MPKAVFFDLDGTLIDSTTRSIHDSSKLAIAKLKENGYKVAIASGREINGICDIEGLDVTQFDGFVLSNGATVLDETHCCISSHPFSSDSVKKILEYGEKHDMALVFETTDQRFAATDYNAYLMRSKEYYHEETPLRRNWTGEEIVKINAFQEEGMDFSELLQDVELEILACPTCCYDIFPKGVSKAVGIHTMMQYWGFQADDYICFGDHENDTEMICNARVGVAVKDACGSKELQRIAPFLCEASGKGGIYQFLLEHHYIR